MTDLEKIRAEIERLKESNNQYLLACSTDVAIQAEAKEQTYDEILSFIDSLDSKESINFDKKDEKFIGLEELENTAHDYGFNVYVKHCFGEERISVKEVENAFKAGAEWQREQMKKEDLLEWLEEELRDAIALENYSNDDADRGRIDAFEKVIDKILSL